MSEYLPVAVVASRLGITPNAVTVRLNRAAKAGSPYDTKADGQRTLVRWEGGEMVKAGIVIPVTEPVTPKPADAEAIKSAITEEYDIILEEMNRKIVCLEQQVRMLIGGGSRSSVTGNHGTMHAYAVGSLRGG